MNQPDPYGGPPGPGSYGAPGPRYGAQAPGPQAPGPQYSPAQYGGPQFSGPQYSGYGPAAAPGPTRTTGLLRQVPSLVVAVLGVLTLFIGFAPYARIDLTDLQSAGRSLLSDGSLNFYDSSGGGSGLLGLTLLLVAGLVAAASLIPGQRGQQGLVAGLSLAGLVVTVGGLTGLTGVSASIGAYLAVVVALLQTVAAVLALIMSTGVGERLLRGRDTPRGYGPGAPAYAPGYGVAPAAPYGSAPAYGSAPGYGDAPTHDHGASYGAGAGGEGAGRQPEAPAGDGAAPGSDGSFGPAPR